MTTSKVRSSNQVFIDEDLDMRVHKIKQLTAGTASGHGVEFDQLNTAIGTAVNPILATIHAPTADLTAAKAVASAARANAQLMMIETLGLFWYDADNAAASNDDTIIRPGDIASDLTVGRWVRHYQTKLYQPNGINPFVYTDNSGQLHIDGNIIQSGAAYETHAEHVYTTNDLIILRDGAVAALATGAYAGFKAKLYDGVNDGYLVFDNAGIARVGDVGSEQPIATRIESPTNGQYAIWDGTNVRLNFAAASLAAVGNGTAQYQIPVTGATTFTPAWTTAANLVGASGLNALSYASASFVKMTAANTFALRTLSETLSDIGAQASHANLTSLAGLTYASASFVKMTGANTFALRTIADTIADLTGLAIVGNGSAQYQIPVTGATTFTPGWTTAANLVGASGLNALSYVSASFIKMTGANTFALRTLAETLSDLGAAPASGSGNYIQNQAAVAQTANMWISGAISTNNTFLSNAGESDSAGLGINFCSNNWGIGQGANLRLKVEGWYNGAYHEYFSITTTGTATFSSTIQATTAKFTNLTDGYIPYHVSDAAGLASSVIYTDGTFVGIGTAGPSTKLEVKGGNITIRSGTYYQSAGDVLGDLNIKNNIDSDYSAGIRAIIDSHGYANDVGLGLYTSSHGISMFIDRLGYVGIGTISPGRSLDVKSSGISGNYGINLTSNAGNIYGFMAPRASSGAGLEQGYIQLNDTGTGKVILDTAGVSYLNGGNVGIGTGAPISKLSVIGNGATYHEAMRWSFNSDYENSYFGYLGNNASDDTHVYIGSSHDSDNADFQIRMKAAGTPVVTVKGSGNVGIGYTDPGSYKLKVNGSGYFANALTIADSTASTTYATGCLILSGGLGVAGAIFTNSTITTVNLAGTGNRSVYVDANGKLCASATGTGIAGNRVYRATPSGTINGTNPTFTITGVSIVTGSEEVFKNGQLMEVGSGNDYTIAVSGGNTIITFETGSIPNTVGATDKIAVNYTPQ